jgi:uncharacterized protein (TIGR03067 family)
MRDLDEPPEISPFSCPGRRPMRRFHYQEACIDCRFWRSGMHFLSRRQPMKTMMLAAIAAILAACGGSRAIAKDEAPKLDGKWVAVALTGDGMEIPPAMLKDVPWYWHIEGRNILSKRPGSGTTIYEEKLTYTLDSSAKPMTFDLTDTAKKETFKSICKIEGDQLTLCFVMGKDEARPTEFTSTKGSKRMLIVWKRVKE